MADINNKPKLQLRSGLSFNGEKSPSPATKLLINHGKPNFTIPRSPKIMNGNGVENGDDNPWPKPTKNKLPPPAPAAFKTDEFVVKSTTLNGILKPSSINKASMQQNGQDEHEMNKVVLRRAKVHHEPALKQDEDENVPEFIRRQRRIQERLAKENLDFENRRSGYFTQVMISPTSPNRKSFMETMSSPAIVPGLEMPPPSPTVTMQREVVIHEEDNTHDDVKEELQKQEPLVCSLPVSLNGHGDEEEVNRAIEEVNKAVAGEDDDKTLGEEYQHEETQTFVTVVSSSSEYKEVTKHQEMRETLETVQTTVKETSPVEITTTTEAAVVNSHVTSAHETISSQQIEQGHEKVEEIVTTSHNEYHEQKHESEVNLHNVQMEVVAPQNGHIKSDITEAFLNAERLDSQTNGGLTNGQKSNGHGDEITISHTNSATPSLATPDPSGEKGVNYEPKTVVSFSQEMGSDVNKYPDTVIVTKEVTSTEGGNEELKELAKLKFEIKEGQKDIEVTPVLKVD